LRRKTTILNWREKLGEKLINESKIKQKSREWGHFCLDQDYEYKDKFEKKLKYDKKKAKNQNKKPKHWGSTIIKYWIERQNWKEKSNSQNNIEQKKNKEYQFVTNAMIMNKICKHNKK